MEMLLVRDDQLSHPKWSVAMNSVNSSVSPLLEHLSEYWKFGSNEGKLFWGISVLVMSDPQYQSSTPSGQLVSCDELSHRIQVFHRGGNVCLNIGSAVQLKDNLVIVITSIHPKWSVGHLYVCDELSHRIQVFHRCWNICKNIGSSVQMRTIVLGISVLVMCDHLNININPSGELLCLR